MATLMHGGAEDSRRAGNSPRPKGRGKSWTEDYQSFTLEAFATEDFMLMLLVGERDREGHALQERHNLRPLSLRR